MKDMQRPGKLRIRIGQELEWEIEPLANLGVVLRLLVGHGNKLDPETSEFPVVLTQLRQVQSSGWSPVATIKVHQERAAQG